MAQHLTFENKSTRELEEFLSKNEIGTPGKSMVYRQLLSTSKLREIPNPTFVSIKRISGITGSCTICDRSYGQEKFSYIRYFSFHKAFKTTSRSQSSKKSKSGIRDEIHSIFLNETQENYSSEKSVFYAYLDNSNQRSTRLCEEFGFEEIRKFSTLTFSRFFPRLHLGVSKLTDHEVEFVKTKIYDVYRDYNFVTDENFKLEDDYYVIKDENGNILAGVQGVNEHWKILDMPGISGKIILHFFGRLPLLKKLISKDFRFMAFENILFEEGKEYLLEKLLESVLALNKKHIGILSLDSQSHVMPALKKISLGTASKLKKTVFASVIAHVQNVSSEKIQDLREKPAFISTLDLT